MNNEYIEILKYEYENKYACCGSPCYTSSLYKVSSYLENKHLIFTNEMIKYLNIHLNIILDYANRIDLHTDMYFYIKFHLYYDLEKLIINKYQNIYMFLDDFYISSDKNFKKFVKKYKDIDKINDILNGNLGLDIYNLIHNKMISKITNNMYDTIYNYIHINEFNYSLFNQNYKNKLKFKLIIE